MKRLITWYTLFFVAFTLLFFLLFRTPLFANQQVLFYRGMGLLALVSAVGLAAGAAVAVKTRLVRLETVIAAVVMSASIHLALFVVFPVTFDRSVTMYLLNALQTQSGRCNGLNKDDLEANFVSGYVLSHDAVGRRINEQAVTDFVRQTGTCVSLTPKGKSFLLFSETVKKVYGLK